MSAYTTDQIELTQTLELAGKRVLDVGCGGGAMMRFMRDAGAIPTGIEVSPGQLSRARTADPENAESYIEGRGEDLPFEDASFDAATFFFSLHHIPQQHMAVALGEAQRVIVPGGALYVVEPVAEGPMYDVERFVVDEKPVRAQAQAAIAQLAATGVGGVQARDYLTAYTYANVTCLVDEFLEVDPARETAWRKNASALKDAFDNLGRPADGGMLFEQPVRAVLFRKRET